MKKSLIYFVISSLIGLGIGYLGFDLLGEKDNSIEANTSSEEAVDQDKNTTETEEANKEKEKPTTVSAETEILSQKGCLGCHAVSGLDLDGGATGPDLSQAFNNVEGKHGKPINEFLKEPTSAVMSSVIGGNPLTEDEISKITNLLQQASQAN